MKRPLVAALAILLTVGACTGGDRSQDEARISDSDRAIAPAPEADPAENPKSTFAMDVDTASYDYARNLIGQGVAPAPDTIRPEEFINAFRHPYPQPDGAGFRITMDGARLPAGHRVTPGGDTRLLRIGLQTRADDTATRKDARLTFVVDVSGSMADLGKLDVVKGALRAYAEQARPTDEIAIVTFSDQAQVLRAMSPVRDRAGLPVASC